MLPPSLAYIDPNAGGWIFQLILPVFIAIIGFWKVLVRRIGGLIRRFRKPADDAKDVVK